MNEVCFTMWAGAGSARCLLGVAVVGAGVGLVCDVGCVGFGKARVVGGGGNILLADAAETLGIATVFFEVVGCFSVFIVEFGVLEVVVAFVLVLVTVVGEVGLELLVLVGVFSVDAIVAGLVAWLAILESDFVGVGDTSVFPFTEGVSLPLYVATAVLGRGGETAVGGFVDPFVSTLDCGCGCGRGRGCGCARGCACCAWGCECVCGCGGGCGCTCVCVWSWG